MRTPTPSPSSSLTHALAPALFGLCTAVCLPLVGGRGAGASVGISPLAGVVVAFAAAACFLLPTETIAMLRGPRPNGRMLARAALSGLLLVLSTFFLVTGLQRGAGVVGAALFLSSIPTFSLLGRKLLWGESLAPLQQGGVLLSLLAIAVWFAFAPSAPLHRGMLVAAAFDPAFLGNACVFLSAVFAALALAAGRPSESRVSVSTWWFHTTGFGLLFSLPLMYGAHAYLYGSLVPFAGVTAGALRENPLLLLPFAFLGVAQIALRLRLLGRAGARLSIGPVSLLWTGSLLVAASLLAGVLGEGVSLVHLATLPLHLLGLCLGRDALVPWAPYAGPREARAPATSGRAA